MAVPIAIWMMPAHKDAWPPPEMPTSRTKRGMKGKVKVKPITVRDCASQMTARLRFQEMGGLRICCIEELEKCGGVKLSYLGPRPGGDFSPYEIAVLEKAHLRQKTET